MLLGMGNLPASGIEPLSPALADGFLTTKPSVKPTCYNQRLLKDPGVQALVSTGGVVRSATCRPSRSPPACLLPVRVFKGTVVSESVQPDLQWSINLPDGSGVKNPAFDPWVGKIPWRRKWEPTPVFLPEKSHGQRSLAGYSPWGRKTA